MRSYLSVVAVTLVFYFSSARVEAQFEQDGLGLNTNQDEQVSTPKEQRVVKFRASARTYYLYSFDNEGNIVVPKEHSTMINDLNDLVNEYHSDMPSNVVDVIKRTKTFMGETSERLGNEEQLLALSTACLELLEKKVRANESILSNNKDLPSDQIKSLMREIDGQLTLREEIVNVSIPALDRRLMILEEITVVTVQMMSLSAEREEFKRFFKPTLDWFVQTDAGLRIQLIKCDIYNPKSVFTFRSNFKGAGKVQRVSTPEDLLRSYLPTDRTYKNIDEMIDAFAKNIIKVKGGVLGIEEETVLFGESTGLVDKKNGVFDYLAANGSNDGLLKLFGVLSFNDGSWISVRAMTSVVEAFSARGLLTVNGNALDQRNFDLRMIEMETGLKFSKAVAARFEKSVESIKIRY